MVLNRNMKVISNWCHNSQLFDEMKTFVLKLKRIEEGDQHGVVCANLCQFPILYSYYLGLLSFSLENKIFALRSRKIKDIGLKINTICLSSSHKLLSWPS